MTTRHHHRNLLSIAFLAFAGLLVVGDPAKACARPTAPKACCKASPGLDCHCCGSSASLAGTTRSEPAAGSVAPTALRIDAPRTGSSCECHAKAPAAPAPKSDSRTSQERRTDPGHDEVIAYLDHAPRPFLPASRLVASVVSPPKSPIYLRTLHLLV